MSDIMDELFGRMLSAQADPQSVRERRAAAKGICPTARVCSDPHDMAGWLKSFAVAAGVLAKAGK